MSRTDLEANKEIFSVSELNAAVRNVLEGSFADIWIEGEISNFAAPGSGHWYFSMKDEHAQVKCAMFRGSQRRVNFTPKNGAHVLIRARVSLYEARGEFQLIADYMEERGEGKLRRAFDALKKKLETAGWFDEDLKKPLPEFPACIGVVTSPTGAAIRDILTVLKRRYPCVPVIIYPTLVQGDTAAPLIAAAIKTANDRNECDVLIISRGGGSLEDLWPFNEESVAKAIFESHIPVISGVGHEVDFTIADFVADVRAPTPSAAAEIAVPDRLELLLTLRRHAQQVTRHITQKLHADKHQLNWMQKHLQQQHPRRKLAEKMQQLDYYEARLQQLAPRLRIQQLQQLLQQFTHQLSTRVKQDIQTQTGKLAQASATLDGISPLKTLQRGYAIATGKDNQLLMDATTMHQGDAIKVKLMKGSLACRVEGIME
jgi:exodeoxyribonuclease VII large subunit